MDIAKLLDIASKLNVPGLLARGIAFVAEVKATADRVPHVLTSADRAELDVIHAGALAANAELDAKLAEAERQ